MITATAAARLLSYTMLGCTVVQAHAFCKAPSLGAFVGVEHSQWREWDATGRRLVHESGNLRRAGLELAAQCEWLDWQLQWSQSQGNRAYDGVTNRYSALNTSSDIRSQTFGAQLWLPLNNAWAAGAEFNWRDIQRHIANQGNVLGYPEQFRYGQAGLGLRYQTALSPSIRLATKLIVGGGRGGTNRIALPGFDARTLPLGDQRYASLGVELFGGQADVQPGLSWKLALQYRSEKHDAGQARALYRNGIATGSAMQPRFTQTSLGADMMLTYRF